jgi:hypothetical protein
MKYLSFILLSSFTFTQDAWPGALSFDYSGMLNGNFSAETLLDTTELPDSGTGMTLIPDSSGSVSIIIPSYVQNTNNEEVYDIFLLYMTDEDGIIEPQSWNIEPINPEDPLDINATMLFIPEVDSIFVSDLIMPIIDGEADSTIIEEILFEILIASYIPVSGTVEITEFDGEIIVGNFNGMLSEVGWPPQFLYVNDGSFEFSAISLNINDKLPVTNFQLLNAYPNPFNPITVIGYQIMNNCDVKLDIYNLQGQLVESLIDSKQELAGYHEITWNATNFPSGIYFARLQTAKFIQTHKLVLVK